MAVGSRIVRHGLNKGVPRLRTGVAFFGKRNMTSRDQVYSVCCTVFTLYIMGLATGLFLGNSARLLDVEQHAHNYEAIAMSSPYSLLPCCCER